MQANPSSEAETAASPRHRVVVVGGGFAGLETVKGLRRSPVDVTLVDRNNYHLFQPLSYQVATGALSAEDIAEPLRKIFRRDRHVHVLMGEVTAFDLEQRVVVLEPALRRTDTQTIPFDTLVVAGGSEYSYFGHDEWRPQALEVKSLGGALQVRARILGAFEAAELESDPETRASLLTFVVVGAGPTGVEMAGQIAELARDALASDFRAIEAGAARVLLVEMDDRVLPAFPPSLSKRATESLRSLGVTPMTGHAVVSVDAEYVDVQSRSETAERIPARTVIWAAGVKASRLAGLLADASEREVDRAGRVTVESDLTLPGWPMVIALGDMVRVRSSRTGTAETLPGLAPVAMQEGRYAGRLIHERLAGHPTQPFRYRDKGNLATIGRARAVADIRGLRIGGLMAWLLWLVVHIFYLIGFENRAVVLVRWTYTFVTRNRGARLIAEAADEPSTVAGAPSA
jgi:NADH dehydrogenase